jgi:hypothetical protein
VIASGRKLRSTSSKSDVVAVGSSTKRSKHMHVEANAKVPAVEVTGQLSRLTGKTPEQVGEHFQNLPPGKPAEIETDNWDEVAAIMKEQGVKARIRYWPPGKQSEPLPKAQPRKRRKRRK